MQRSAYKGAEHEGDGVGAPALYRAGTGRRAPMAVSVKNRGIRRQAQFDENEDDNVSPIAFRRVRVAVFRL